MVRQRGDAGRRCPGCGTISLRALVLTHVRMHAGHDSLLQQKRLASVPAPVRRHNPMSLNRFDIAVACDTNGSDEDGDDENGQQQQDEEAEQQALQNMSPSPTGRETAAMHCHAPQPCPARHV